MASWGLSKRSASMPCYGRVVQRAKSSEKGVSVLILESMVPGGIDDILTT